MTNLSRRLTAAGAIGALFSLLLSTPALADNVRAAQWELGWLKISEAGKTSVGEGISVAVVDTGVDEGHPDLIGNVLPGASTIPGDSNGGHPESDSHGTEMASIIAAHGHGPGSRDGVIGIAPRATILPIRALNGQVDLDETIAKAINFAISSGVRVICMAFSRGGSVPLLQAIQRAEAADIVLVAAAGNLPEDHFVTAPASYPGVLAVGAVDRQGNHSSFSVQGDQIAISAPGNDIPAATLGRAYRSSSGTSGATAIVAGVVALVRSKYPNMPAAEVIHRITATAIDKGPPGRDPEYGYGIVDPVAALTAQVPPLSASAGPTGTAPAQTTAQPTNQASPPTQAARHTLLYAALVVGAGFVVVILWMVNRRRRDPT